MNHDDHREVAGRHHFHVGGAHSVAVGVAVAVAVAVSHRSSFRPLFSFRPCTQSNPSHHHPPLRCQNPCFFNFWLWPPGSLLRLGFAILQDHSISLVSPIRLTEETDLIISLLLCRVAAGLEVG